MRVLVCGGRDWTDEALLYATLDSLPKPLVVVEGGAPGADRMARDWAVRRGVPWEEYKAHWRHMPRCPPGCADVVGKAAGPLRNQKMLDTGPHLVVAFHDDLAASKGTRDMVSRASKAGVEVRLVGHHGTETIRSELRRTGCAGHRTPRNPPAGDQLRFNADGT